MQIQELSLQACRHCSPDRYFAFLYLRALIELLILFRYFVSRRLDCVYNQCASMRSKNSQFEVDFTCGREKPHSSDSNAGLYGHR